MDTQNILNMILGAVSKGGNSGNGTGGGFDLSSLSGMLGGNNSGSTGSGGGFLSGILGGGSNGGSKTGSQSVGGNATSAISSILPAVGGLIGSSMSSNAIKGGFERVDGSIDSKSIANAEAGKGLKTGSEWGGKLGKVSPVLGIIGTVLGAGVGYAEGKSKGDRLAEAAERVYDQSQANTDLVGSYNSTALADQDLLYKNLEKLNKFKMGGTYYGMFSNGGDVPNALVDNNEVIKSPDGDISTAIGPEATDKILASLMPGSKILSDTMKFGGKTYAELGKNIPKVKASSDKIISDRSAPKLDKDTAKINISNANNAFEKIMKIQEDNRIIDNIDKFKDGIRKYKLGGVSGLPKYNEGKDGAVLSDDDYYDKGIISQLSTKLTPAQLAEAGSAIFNDQKTYPYGTRPKDAASVVETLFDESKWNMTKDRRSSDNSPLYLGKYAISKGWITPSGTNASSETEVTGGSPQVVNPGTMSDNVQAVMRSGVSSTDQFGSNRKMPIFDNTPELRSDFIEKSVAESEPYNKYKVNPEGDASNSKENPLQGLIGEMSDYSDRLVDLAPYFYNMGRSNEGLELVNPEDLTVKGRATADIYDPKPELEENRRQSAIMRRQSALKNSGSDAAFSSYIARQKAGMDSAVWDKKNKYDNNQRSSVQSTNLGIEGENNKIRSAVREMNMKTRAKARDFEAKAVQQLSEWNQRNRLDRVKKDQDQLNLDALNISLKRYLSTDEGKKWAASVASSQYKNNG